jgi:hypothetical protein
VKSNFSEKGVKDIPHTYMTNITELPGQVGSTPASYSGVPDSNLDPVTGYDV